MKVARILCLSLVVIAALCSLLFAQGAAQHFSKDGLSFDYPEGWVLEDVSTSDVQSLKLTRNGVNTQLSIAAHKGRIPEEKMPDAHKAFIDPYVEALVKQLSQWGKVERTPDTSEISGVKAEGEKLHVPLSGDAATAQIYYGRVSQRVVMITYFGPDSERAKFLPTLDLVRTSLKIEEAKPKASPTPK